MEFKNQNESEFIKKQYGEIEHNFFKTTFTRLALILIERGVDFNDTVAVNFFYKWFHKAALSLFNSQDYKDYLYNSSAIEAKELILSELSEILSNLLTEDITAISRDLKISFRSIMPLKNPLPSKRDEDTILSNTEGIRYFVNLMHGENAEIKIGIMIGFTYRKLVELTAVNTLSDEDIRKTAFIIAVEDRNQSYITIEDIETVHQIIDMKSDR